MKRVLKKLTALLLLFSALTVSAAADQSQKIYPVSSPAYRQLLLLSVLSGIAPPSDSGPWSEAELRRQFSRIPKESLGTEALPMYEHLQEQLHTTRPNLQVSLQAAPEIYLHTDRSEFFDQDEEWVIDHTRRRAPVDAVLEFSFPNAFYGYFDMNIQNNRFYDKVTGTTDSSGFFGPPISTNLILDRSADNLDASFPWRGFISVGSDHWNIQLGRDRIRWGNGITGNLLVGDHMDYHEFFKATAFNEWMKATSLIISFIPPSAYLMSTADEGSAAPDFSDPISGVELFIAHRFEFTLWDRLNITVSEAIMYQGEGIFLSTLNPFSFYHNLYIPGNANSIAGLDLQYTLAQGVYLYGQFAVDEFAVPGESSTGEGSYPNALACLGGIHLIRPAEDGRIFSLTLEAAYTDPYMYLRDHGLTYPIDFIVANRAFNRSGSNLFDEDVLGFSWGPDTIIVALDAGTTSIDSWDLGMRLTYLAQGCIDQDSQWMSGSDEELDPASLISPTTVDPADCSKDAVEHQLIISMRAEAPLGTWTTLSGALDWIHRWNPENLMSHPHVSDLQLTLGARITLAAGR